MPRLSVPNWTNSNHQAAIERYIEECDELPVIRVALVEEGWYVALEGSHRCFAMDELGYRIPVVVCSPEDQSAFGECDLEYFDGEEPTVAEVVEYMVSTAAKRPTVRGAEIEIR
jgi:hypothetical protein